MGGVVNQPRRRVKITKRLGGSKRTDRHIFKGRIGICMCIIILQSYMYACYCGENLLYSIFETMFSLYSTLLLNRPLLCFYI